jgi:hypothetical protein
MPMRFSLIICMRPLRCDHSFRHLARYDESPDRFCVCDAQKVLVDEAHSQLQYARSADLEERIQFARNQRRPESVCEGLCGHPEIGVVSY